MVAAQDLIQQAYNTLDVHTPLVGDCGLLCERRCCQGEEYGMLLLPGEAMLLGDVPGYSIVQSEGEDILLCNGSCNRRLRPYACRIFPLYPLVQAKSSGSYSQKIIFDPRARAMCPLAQPQHHISIFFCHLIRQSTALLLKNATIAHYLCEQSSFVEAVEDIRLHLV